MARINLYEELYVDPRFTKLCELVPRHVAFGSLICLWENGQAYWKRGKEVPENIPAEVGAHLPSMREMVAAGFAKLQPDGSYYCAGANDRWTFLRKHQEARRAAGLKSAAARREKYGSAVPNNAPNAPHSPSEQPPNKPPNKSNKGPEQAPNLPNTSTSTSGIQEEPPLAPPQGELGDLGPPTPAPKPARPSRAGPLDSAGQVRFATAHALFKATTGIGVKGPQAERRYAQAVRSDGDQDAMLKAIRNYGLMLEQSEWQRTPKTSFETFLGSERGWFYRDWIDWTPPPVKRGHLSAVSDRPVLKMPGEG